MNYAQHPSLVPDAEYQGVNLVKAKAAGKRVAATLTAIFCLGVIVYVVVALMAASAQFDRLYAFHDITGVPACVTEDSTDCFWNAKLHGNGQGQSFINIEGESYFLED